MREESIRMMKKLIKIILLIAVELLFLKCVLDLAGFQKLITEGPIYDKMIYLLYMKDYHWWYNLPIDIVEYRGISRDSDLVEIKTDEMEIRTVKTWTTLSLSEKIKMDEMEIRTGTSLNKTIVIRYCANDMENLVYYIEMSKAGIEDRKMYFYYKENSYNVYPDTFGQEVAQLLENATGKNEAGIHEYMEQCDTNIGKFVEYLCHSERNNLLVQISIYIVLMAAVFMGIIHIVRKKENV